MPSNRPDPTHRDAACQRRAIGMADVPRGRRASIWRFRSYLRPYRWRFVLLVVFSVAGIGASILVPLVTRSVDRRSDRALRPARPVRARRGRDHGRDRGGAADVRPAMDRLEGDARGRDGHPGAALRQAPTAAAGLPLPMGVRSAAVPDHLGPLDHPPVPGVRTGVPGGQHPPDPRRRRDPHPPLLAARSGRAGLDGSGDLGLAADPEGLHPPIPGRAGPDRRRGVERGGDGPCPAGHQVIRSG